MCHNRDPCKPQVVCQLSTSQIANSCGIVSPTNSKQFADCRRHKPKTLVGLSSSQTANRLRIVSSTNRELLCNCSPAQRQVVRGLLVLQTVCLIELPDSQTADPSWLSEASFMEDRRGGLQNRIEVLRARKASRADSGARSQFSALRMYARIGLALLTNHTAYGLYG